MIPLSYRTAVVCACVCMRVCVRVCLCLHFQRSEVDVGCPLLLSTSLYERGSLMGTRTHQSAKLLASELQEPTYL